MDVSNILASHAEKYQSITVEKETPLEVDAGLLLATDLNPIEEETYNENLEDHLQNLARDGVQSLISSLFSLPSKPSPDGPLAILPPPVYQLPRAKPLPKPKPPTKWEKFAAAKGIQHKVRDKKVWDEEKQNWVNRWGRHGKNREIEEQWIHEVPTNADIDYDPRKTARDSRKERVAKNEKKHQQNAAHDIDRTLAVTRTSTASMGKFDKRLEGEKKLRGIKRKFDPNEGSIEQEKNSSLALLAKMDSDKRKMRTGPRAEEGDVNVRKAVRFASKGKGGLA
ncbi:ribosome biogenesis regulatory protein-domain-containing protein [Gymnopilus junonius]|uniref:Ribosome biogenesis regulatory protein n=1 Tax=Gymnopilus junonius TaxID=109634 RepID=A0A9P5TW23_GYMJU|nr:ribosome biogenesis regulatory protein-domain-containing protein [Gymnopilus junonius]